MKSFFVLITFCTLIINSYSQSVKQGDEFFNQGVTALNNKQYLLADSLFSLSINVFEREDAFVNRAIARKVIGDIDGYCCDVEYASRWNDKQIKYVFEKDCCSIKEFFYDSLMNPIKSSDYVYKEIREQNNVTNYTILKLLDRSGNQIRRCNIIQGDTILQEESIKMAQFPNGQKALYEFLEKNIIYPAKELNSEAQGVVYVTFVIKGDGSVAYTHVLRGVSKKLNLEALRVVNLMPKWNPATLNKKPVNTQFNLPISFILK
jgi:hypothetical protein